MIVTVCFDVKNYVEVMESWPINIGDITFYLEREENILKRVCVAFSNVGIEHAPRFTPPSKEIGHARMEVNGSGYAALAREKTMNWQAVVSGIQIIDLDYDNYDLRFAAENIDEEAHIQIKSVKSSPEALNAACDFEQIGRAFCAEPVSDDQIESTSHFREGRLAYEAGRYVDAYNNMFLFLETRYCDGKTKAAQQIELLSKEKKFCESLEQTAADFADQSKRLSKEKFELFKHANEIREKIKILVQLRGNLRHHSLKSPHRWDPNQQNEHESAARFLGAVVGDLVIKESLDEIYAPDTLEKFRKLSVSTGNETKINLITHRLEKKQTLNLDMSVPTTVVSSQLCLFALRSAIKACEKEGQLADTVRFEASCGKRNLDLFSLDFDVWAYTQTRTIETNDPIKLVRCSFEHFKSGIIVKNEFSISVRGHQLTIPDVWKLLMQSFNHIECRDPTTRIMSLKLFLQDGRKAIVAYRVGALVGN